MKTAAAYIRVSTEEQTEYSPDSQLKAIRNYAREHDLILPEEFVFVDEGISGRKADTRPAFQKMIGTAKLKPKPFDVILLWKFSRFARNRQDSIVYKSMLRKQCGIDVVSVTEQLSDDHTSILIEAMIEAMDEYYSLNLAEEVRRGMLEKFSRGEVVSQPPFGYRMGGNVYVPDEINAPVVQMIFSDFLSGLGTRQIASKLNKLGFKSAKGNPFENRTVEYILTNPVYTGKLRRSRDPGAADRFHELPENTVIVEGKHQPLISEEVFRQAQLRRKELKRIYAPKARHAPAEFMLKGLVRCDSCGATLTMMSGGKYIQCCNYSRGACSVSHCISLNKINDAVMLRLRSDFENKQFNIDVRNNSAPNAPPPEAALLEKERKKLDRVRDAYAAGVDSLEEYSANKAKILRRIAELENSLSRLHIDSPPADIISGRLESGLSILEDPSSSETLKNLTLRSIVDRIVFQKPLARVEIFYKL